MSIGSFQGPDHYHFIEQDWRPAQVRAALSHDGWRLNEDGYWETTIGCRSVSILSDSFIDKNPNWVAHYFIE